MKSLSPRTGRPIVGETKKELRLQLRLNHEEMQLIDECASKLGKNRTETVMQGVKLLERELAAK